MGPFGTGPVPKLTVQKQVMTSGTLSALLSAQAATY